MPILVLFLVFTMANIALPGTSSFVGEFLLLAGVFKISTVAAFFGATGMILGGLIRYGYSIELHVNLKFGILLIFKIWTIVSLWYFFLY